jgi:hypothetical protein
LSCVDRPAAHGGEQILDVEHDRIEPEPLEDCPMELARQDAQAETAAVRRRPDRPHAVAEVSKAVVRAASA